MNKVILTSFLALFLSSSMMAQSAEMQSVEQAILKFVKAADASDADKLSTYLDENYRVVMNRLFGSTQVSVMDRATYLDKIKSKEFGGDSREIEIESITLNGSVASAKVKLVGSKMTFISILSIVKDDKGMWKLVSDMPMVE